MQNALKRVFVTHTKYLFSLTEMSNERILFLPITVFIIATSQTMTVTGDINSMLKKQTRMWRLSIHDRLVFKMTNNIIRTYFLNWNRRLGLAFFYVSSVKTALISVLERDQASSEIVLPHLLLMTSIVSKNDFVIVIIITRENFI